HAPSEIVEAATDPEAAAAATNRYLASSIFSLEHPAEVADSAAEPSRWKRLSRALAAQSLSDYLDARRPPDEDRPELLIFDQFEEILLDPTDGPDKQQFFTVLGQALLNRQRWALFVMREEFIAALQPYRHLLPTGLSTTFRLDLLGSAAALEAIRGPAAKLG